MRQLEMEEKTVWVNAAIVLRVAPDALADLIVLIDRMPGCRRIYLKTSGDRRLVVVEERIY
jgi:hypothetical protein